MATASIPSAPARTSLFYTRNSAIPGGSAMYLKFGDSVSSNLGFINHASINLVRMTIGVNAGHPQIIPFRIIVGGSTINSLDLGANNFTAAEDLDLTVNGGNSIGVFGYSATTTTTFTNILVTLEYI